MVTIPAYELANHVQAGSQICQREHAANMIFCKVISQDIHYRNCRMGNCATAYAQAQRSGGPERA